MRWILTVLLCVSCSHPFKYKYASPSRGIASLSPKVKVKKIEIELKDQTLFASGMDSTYVIVKLFDDQENILTNVNPLDLTLSTNTDLEAKPFVYKQGVYQAQILPRAKSGIISLKVDWQETVGSPEVILQGRTHPTKDAITPVIHESWEDKSVGEVTAIRGNKTSQRFTEGFSFSNVTHSKVTREFSFDYLEQARQNISFSVEDSYEDEDAEAVSFNSLFMLFPRKSLPIVEQLTGTLDVTLPTGEKLIFQKDSKEIVDGVFTENGPTENKFPDLKYKGKGILLRANALNESPEMAQEDLNEVVITNGSTGQECKRPKEDFWEQVSVSPNEFKFATDLEFENYLKLKCGFSLPKL